MRLFFYLKHFPLYDSPCGEGVSKSVHGLASGLAAIGQRVTILGEGPISGTRHSEFGYEICIFSAPNTSPSIHLSSGLKAYIKMGVAPNDRVILNGIFHRSVAAFARVLKQQGIPYIVAPHDPYHPEIFQRNKLLKFFYWHLQESPMLRSAWAVQILDPRHAAYLQQRRVKTQTISLPNGFDAADVLPESQLVWHCEDRPKIYFLGRFDSYNKGLDLLIQAVAELVKTQPLHLTLQGPEWGDRAILQTQVQQLGIAEQVTFLDPDYDRCPAELAMEHDIFCVPSRFEGFSLSGLEAMLGGRVIVISDVAGLSPYVTKSGAGQVVEPSVDSLVQAFSLLLSCRDRWPAMGKSGRDYVLQHLQWETIAQSAAKAYGASRLTDKSHIPVKIGE